MSFAEVNLLLQRRHKLPLQMHYTLSVSRNLIFDRYILVNALKFDGLLHFPFKLTYCCILWKGDFLNLNVLTVFAKSWSSLAKTYKHGSYICNVKQSSSVGWSLYAIFSSCKILSHKNLYWMCAFKPFVVIKIKLTNITGITAATKHLNRGRIP